MAQNPDVIGREVLPIPDRPVEGKMALDARDAEFPPITPLRPPPGAPNVVVVLLDDMGFGAPSVTGGPCEMPAMQQIADDGLLYNRFHTTALCSPSRAALMAGPLAAQSIPLPFAPDVDARQVSVVVTPGRASMRGLPRRHTLMPGLGFRTDANEVKEAE